MVYLDLKGLLCPEPVMMMHQKVAELKAEDMIHVEATDPSTSRDIPKFCQFLGHELVDQNQDEAVYHYIIKINK